MNLFNLLLFLSLLMPGDVKSAAGLNCTTDSSNQAYSVDFESPVCIGAHSDKKYTSIFINPNSTTTDTLEKTLTLDEAIRISLENNYGIQIQRNRAEIASNNRTLGNAGFLPTLTANGSRSGSVEDSRFELAGADEVSENLGARSTFTNAGINLSWTLFDGMQMFIGYDRLGELEQLGEEEFRLNLELLVEQVITAYSDVNRVRDQLEVIESSIEITRERIEIAETKLDLGTGSEYELLQARTDLNADRAALLREENRLEAARIRLNELLARDPLMVFETSSELALNRQLTYDELYNRMVEENASLQMARIESRIAELELREIRGSRLPELELTSGYSYSRTDGGGGFLLFNETQGFNVGITARINLFDGFNNRLRVQNAEINRKNSELFVEDELNRLEATFARAFRDYENTLELVDLEQENLGVAEETLDIALERFRLGAISNLEFREAQRALLNAENRLIEAIFEAKLAETELLRLSGVLQHIGL